MGRYFFNLYNDEISIDEEGVELSDDEAAREWARREVRYQAAESVRQHSHLILSHKVVICNEAGSEISAITFGEVVAVHSQ